MAAGLLESHRLLERDRRLHPSGTRLLVLMSDGEANVPLTKGADVGTEVMALADTTRRLAHRIVVLHTGESDSPLLSRFANEVGGLYRRCDTPASRDVVATLSNSKDIG
jgi:Mg-chelatase subunit ChlD